jgi:predicted metal-dependent HD superfamily phosphohydrolase
MIHKSVGVGQVSAYVRRLFIDYQNKTPFLIYHNLLHTETVVARASEIAAVYSITETEWLILITAAWFHDCGHLFGPAPGHELRGVLKMKEFMDSFDLSEEIIEGIASCILATEMPGKPGSLLEEVLCDADLYHLGNNQFYVTDLLVKREYELRNNLLVANWDKKSLDLLMSHHFYTGYCRELLHDGKMENIKMVRARVSVE